MSDLRRHKTLILSVTGFALWIILSIVLFPLLGTNGPVWIAAGLVGGYALGTEFHDRVLAPLQLKKRRALELKNQTYLLHKYVIPFFHDYARFEPFVDFWKGLGVTVEAYWGAYLYFEDPDTSDAEVHRVTVYELTENLAGGLPGSIGLNQVFSAIERFYARRSGLNIPIRTWVKDIPVGMFGRNFQMSITETGLLATMYYIAIYDETHSTLPENGDQ